jgi:Na+-driven multidrug efflux pump
MVLDALFVGILGWGLVGAALATMIAEIFGGLTPVLYFARKNDSLLQLVRTVFMWKVLWKAAANGSSEMMNSIAASVVTILYNWQLLKFAGSEGVAAYGVIMYVVFIFHMAFVGYTVGIAPVFSYHFGARHKAELSSLFQKSVVLLFSAGAVMTAVSWALSGTLTEIFVGYDAALQDMTLHGMRIFVSCFLISWFSVFGSSFFTALGNGLISAVISFLRTLVFESGAVMLLPLILGLDGIWYSYVVAEVMAAIVTGAFLWGKGKKELR